LMINEPKPRRKQVPQHYGGSHSWMGW
jgi:hypothetical protein